jgi:hypothetical protein
MTRDSVCAGDDVDAPHEKTLSIYSFIEPVAFVSQFASDYLPQVEGVGHSWDCVLNGQVIATVKTDGIQPIVSEISYADKNEINFVYHPATH